MSRWFCTTYFNSFFVDSWWSNVNLFALEMKGYHWIWKSINHLFNRRDVYLVNKRFRCWSDFNASSDLKLLCFRANLRPLVEVSYVSFTLWQSSSVSTNILVPWIYQVDASYYSNISLPLLYCDSTTCASDPI